MSAKSTALLRAFRHLAFCTFALAALAAASPAVAQSSCQHFTQTTLPERQELIKKYNALGKKPNANDACAIFTKLTANGTAGLKWLDENKDWGQVPDRFVEGFKADHAKVSDFKTQACKVAAQAAAMAKKAQEGSRSRLLGGDGLSGTQKMPQGAL